MSKWLEPALWHLEYANFDAMWEEVAPHLERALACTIGKAEVTIDQMKLLARSGHYKIVSVRRGEECIGALAVEFVDYPEFRSANVAAMGGKHLVDDRGLWGQFAAWLKRNGASHVEATCRDEVAAVLRRKVRGQSAVFIRGEL